MLDKGIVRIYKFNSGNLTWVKTATFDDSVPIDKFGSEFAINFDDTIAAAKNTRFNGPIEDRAKGFVQIFRLVSGNWQVETSLIGEATFDEIGDSISLNDTGDGIAISSQKNDTNGDASGHVKVYGYNFSTGWTVFNTNLNGASAGERFGQSVSLSNNFVVATSSIVNNGGGTEAEAGQVRVYTDEST